MKLWGGRFEGETGALMRRLNDSFGFDRRLYAADIRGSVAYAGALYNAGLLSEDEHKAIVGGLEQVKAEFDEDRFEPAPTDEDVHTAVERRLTELVGAAGGKLHTGRSRNDQVALDVRLWLLDAMAGVRRDMAAAQQAIVDKAAAHLDAIMPGYTHLQPAQPVLFSHWLMSFFWMFERDQQRLADCGRRVSVLPLGAGALAGNPFAIDREALAADLGMQAVSQNSMDAVSDRDFIAEFLFDAALIGVHVSRLAEDLILYASPGFGFVAIDETYTTGSSLMPQKRNPDALELARGKSARLTGALVTLMTLLKGLPSTYNKDMQEDKEPLFDAVETLAVTLPVLVGVIQTMKPNAQAMLAALDESMLATDLADYLVERGVPFREAHHMVGRLVKRAEERGVRLPELPADDFRAESDVFGPDVKDVFDFARSVALRSVTGGTAPEAVSRQIERAGEILAGYEAHS